MRDIRWLEAGIFFKKSDFTIANVLEVYTRLLHPAEYFSWHYFLEPNCELRFRVLASEKQRLAIQQRINLLMSLPFIKKTIYREYRGEEDMYGAEGWVVARGYYENGAATAKKLLFLNKVGHLTSPVKNWSPLHFHLNRYVHLFSNQLGYSVWNEFTWALRYAWNRLTVWVCYKLKRR